MLVDLEKYKKLYYTFNLMCTKFEEKIKKELSHEKRVNLISSISKRKISLEEKVVLIHKEKVVLTRIKGEECNVFHGKLLSITETPNEYEVFFLDDYNRIGVEIYYQKKEFEAGLYFRRPPSKGEDLIYAIDEFPKSLPKKD